MPRGLRPGFHRNGSPFSGSCAEKPGAHHPAGERPGAHAAAGGVVGVVDPLLVPARVDRGAGGQHAVEAVAAGRVGPRGRLTRASAAEFPPRHRVAQAVGVVAARGHDRDVGAVGRDVDVADPMREHACAPGPRRHDARVVEREQIGAPRREGRRVRRQVHDRDLGAGLTAGGVEVAGRHQRAAVRRDVELPDLRRAADRVAGERDVQGRVGGAGREVERGQPRAGLSADRRELAAGVQAAVPAHEVVDVAVRVRREARHQLAVGQAQAREPVEVRAAVDRGVPATDVDRRAVGPGREGLDGLVERGPEVRIDHPGRGVEGEQVVAGEVRRAAGVLHGGERAAHDHSVADDGQRVDAAVGDVRGEVRGVRTHDGAVRRVDGARLRDDGEQGGGEERGQDEGEGTAGRRHGRGSFSRRGIAAS